jgi:hypothetical protein
VPQLPDFKTLLRRASEPQEPVTYAEGRFTTRTYLSRSFAIDRPESRDYGRPARFVTKVFDCHEWSEPPTDAEEYTVSTSTAGRVQLKLLVAREAGAVKELWLERVTTKVDGSTTLTKILNLKRDDSKRLIDLLLHLGAIPVEGDGNIRIDDSLLSEILADPEAVEKMYGRNREEFRSLIVEDESASDLIALGHRRSQLNYFHRLLDEPEFFSAERTRLGAGPERVWQNLFEENPWILGVGLTGHLMTSWDDNKLEQVVLGFSVAGSGKRADALMRTAGSIQYMTFAEIKHHETPLLHGTPYRPGCWSPSGELAGGLVQVQQTVHRASMAIGERLDEIAADGSRTGDATYLLRPRSFLIAGTLEQLRGSQGGVHEEKNRSFELFRRNLNEPEVLTFDEVLARAQWQVELAATEEVAEPDGEVDVF